MANPTIVRLGKSEDHWRPESRDTMLVGRRLILPRGLVFLVEQLPTIRGQKRCICLMDFGMNTKLPKCDQSMWFLAPLLVFHSPITWTHPWKVTLAISYHRMCNEAMMKLFAPFLCHDIKESPQLQRCVESRTSGSCTGHVNGWDLVLKLLCYTYCTKLMKF